MSASMSYRIQIIWCAKAEEIASGSGKLWMTTMCRSPRCAERSWSSSAALVLGMGSGAELTSEASRSRLRSRAFIDGSSKVGQKLRLHLAGVNTEEPGGLFGTEP